jgi:hypothetical protein
MSLQDTSAPKPKQKQLIVTDRLRLQRVFARMKQSCYDWTHKSYVNYGGRGVYICAEWLDTGSSEAFVQWAQANGYQHGLDINRIDNDGPYSPDNCNFVTRRENCRNQRQTVRVVYEGVLQPARPLLEAMLPSTVTRTRIDLYIERISKQGLSLEEAVKKPFGLSNQEKIARRKEECLNEKEYQCAFLYNGKLARMMEHMADAGFATDCVTQRTFAARKAAGWPLSRIFTEPIAGRS